MIGFKRFFYYFDKYVLHILPDLWYLKIQYELKMGKKLNLKSPKTYNEKLQWLKLYNRNPEYTLMADKYEVRKYITKKIGQEYLIPILGVWNKFDEIDFDNLPDQFVLKCTHDSGSVIICKDKKKLDLIKIKRQINKNLSRNYYFSGREWVYKYIKPRIIAEKLMKNELYSDLYDYKIFCFHGEPKVIQVDINRFTDHKRNFYTPQWEYLSLELCYPSSPDTIIQKPKSLELMLDLARKLSYSSIHLRVDFYIIKESIYFGELTFYHGNGNEKFSPVEWDKVFGDWIELPPNGKK